MGSNTVRRVQLGSILLGVIGTIALARMGHAPLALPLMCGVIWGAVNLILLERLISHVRPDTPVNGKALGRDIALKGALYVVAGALLWGRSPETIIAAGVGLGLVLTVIVLRALGWLIFGQSRRRNLGSV